MCLLLTNVTLVIPSADEISYLTFMSTMYNSPSPSLRELAGFYVTDLKMTAFEVCPQCIWQLSAFQTLSTQVSAGNAAAFVGFVQLDSSDAGSFGAN